MSVKNPGAPMDLGYVKKLVKLLSDSEVHEIEIEEEGRRVRVAKAAYAPPPASYQVMPQAVPVAVPTHLPGSFPHTTASVPHVSPVPSPAPLTDTDGRKFHEIKSPIVGTFYRSPAPDAAPFVQVGSQIEVGMVLCIVEAMKLMNEIESDVAGKITKILVENGQPVEYGQTLFLVE